MVIFSRFHFERVGNFEVLTGTLLLCTLGLRAESPGRWSEIREKFPIDVQMIRASMRFSPHEYLS